jgi:hypothetical protein
MVNPACPRGCWYVTETRLRDTQTHSNLFLHALSCLPCFYYAISMPHTHAARILHLLFHQIPAPPLFRSINSELYSDRFFGQSSTYTSSFA